MLCWILLPHAKLHSAIQYEFGGAFKSFAVHEQRNQRNVYLDNSHPYLEERLRLQFAAFTSNVRLEVANETFFTYQKKVEALFLLPSITPKSAWDTKWDLITKDELVSFNRLDRLFLQVRMGSTQWIVGKQVVAIGVGQIFGAVSQTERYSFNVIDPEYPKTEDAVTFIWSGPLQLEARFLPKTEEQREHNFNLRAKGSKGGYDFAMTAGKSDDKPFVGLETAGNLGDSVIRGELVGYQNGSQGVVQGLMGWDQVWSAAWSTTFEMFYNGFGKVKDYLLETFPHRSAPYRGKLYAGAHVTLEITPLLKAHSIIVANLLDPSSLLNLYFNYSLGNSIDVLLGQFVNVGGEVAEFGGTLPVLGAIRLGAPNITYLGMRLYF